MGKKTGLLISTGSIALAVLMMSVPVGQASTDNGVPKEIEQLKEQVTALQNVEAAHTTQIENLQQGLQNIQNEQKGIETTQQLIEGEQRNIESELHGMENTQSGIEATERGIETTQQGIEAAQRGIEAEQRGIESQLGQLQSQIQGLLSTSSEGSGGSTNASGHTVSGTIRDVNGNPFYVAIAIDANGHRYPVTNANATTGTFTFTNIPDGTYTIEVEMNTYHLSSSPTFTVSGEDISGLQMQFSNPTYSVEGKVLQNGSPLGNERISLMDAINGNPGNIFSSWQTQSDGTFNLTGVAPGSYTILIGSDPFHPLLQQTLTVDGNLTGIVIGQ